MIIEIDIYQLLAILGVLLGFNLAKQFSDFDKWVTKRVPKDFKNTFTWYVVSRLLKAIHHYMVGIAIMVLFYPPHSLASLAMFSVGVGVFLEETPLFVSDLKKVVNRLKNLRNLRGD